MKILIVEDELDLLNEINSFLTKENHICETVTSFNNANEKLAIYEYDIVILDITLPGGSGLDILQKLKTISSETGVIIISAKNSLSDKLSGLDLGADDYLTKPFHLSELNARVKSIFRRRKLNGASKIIFNEIEICEKESTAFIHGKKVKLTRKEYELLLFFISNQNRLVTKESIAEHLWGDNIDISDNFDFIYTHINNLRKKITTCGGNDYLKTMYGMGYKFVL